MPTVETQFRPTAVRNSLAFGHGVDQRNCLRMVIVPDERPGALC